MLGYNGPPLATGLTSNAGGASKYPDFHWAACFTLFGITTCSVVYTGTNILMYDVLSDQNRAGPNHASLRGQQGMGLIYIDFPGQPLVAAITANNPYYGGGGPTGPITSGVNSNKCVDLSSSKGVAGNKIQMWDCNSSGAQNWTINANGTITIAGSGCMDITNNNYANGTLIQWWPCNGSPGQQWKAENGQLVNPASGKCLDDPNSNTTNGTQLVLWTCNGAANQQWRIPDLPRPSMSLSVSVTEVTEGHSPVFTVRMPADATGEIGFYNLWLPGPDKGMGLAPIEDGVATLRTPTRALLPGQNMIQASYGGNASYAANDSNTVTVTVTAP